MKKYMQGLFVIAGLIVGLVCWGILLIALGSDEFGKTGALEYLLIFSPVIGVVLPVALNLLDAKRSIAGTWLLALAPLAGLANVRVCYFIASVTGSSPNASSLPLVLANFIYVLPAAILFRKLGADVMERL